MSTTKNVFHKKKWNAGTLKLHVYPPLIPPIKSNHDEKLDKDFAKIKLLRDTTSQKLDLYEFKIALFDNEDPEEFFLFIRNFNTTLETSGALLIGKNTKYLCTLVNG